MKFRAKRLLWLFLFILSGFTYKFADNRDYFPILLNLVDQAKKGIFISHFEYNWDDTTKKLVRHLLRAKKRGVEIKILLDDGLDVNKRAIKKLEFFGFSAKLDSPLKVNHTKLVIVDDTYVLLGSTNFSYMSLEYNNEANILIADTGLTRLFKKYFRSLWLGRKFRGISWQRTDVVPFFDKDYFYTVRAELSRAKRRIYIILYGINKGSSYVDELLSILQRKAAQGVVVKVLLDYSSFDNALNEINEDAISYLKDRGIQAYLDGPDTITHSKVIVIDDEAILSSSNWGTGPFFRYASCSLILRDKNIAEHYVKYFEQILNSTKKGYDKPR